MDPSFNESNHPSPARDPKGRANDPIPHSDLPVFLIGPETQPKKLTSPSEDLAYALEVPHPLASAPVSAVPPTPLVIDESSAALSCECEQSGSQNPLEDQKAHRPPAGRAAFLFMLTMVTTFFALWIVGPRLVEEYHYAAELGRARGEYANAVEQLEKAPLNKVSLAYELVAQRIRPSVVSITAPKKDPMLMGIGSGVIFSEEGYIVTNAHVVKDATSFTVELHNRHSYPATLVGLDSTSDVAVLKIDAPDLIPATWGDSDNMDVGSIVWAVGSPYGFQQTITSGVLSGKDRPGDTKHRKQSLLQTDAAVNPGNSGGPLVDAQGHVIGINTSIFGETFQGISFAVPSSTAKFVYEEIVRSGKVKRGYLGVYARDVDQRFAAILKLPDLAGARLSNVEPRSPAAQAGIRRGDVIRQWNGKPVLDHRQLFRLSESTPPNSEVELVVYRDGLVQKTTVTLGELPEFAESQTPSEFSRGM